MDKFPELAGRVALVTGASQGLGKHFAKGLAKQGMHVAVMARNKRQLDKTADEIRRIGVETIALAADVTDRNAVERSVSEIESKLGPIDVLVNAAGSVLPVGPTWLVDPDQWWQTIETNLRGSVNTCCVISRSMSARKQGRIINVASSTVLHGRPYMSAYMTSKTAIVKFTEILAAELHKFKVRAFSIHPGTVKTAMAQELLRRENAQWLPWFEKIFVARKNNPPALGSKLVQYLSTGRADHLSGRFFLIPFAGKATVEAFKRAKHGETEDANLLRIRILEKDHPEAGV